MDVYDCNDRRIYYIALVLALWIFGTRKDSICEYHRLHILYHKRSTRLYRSPLHLSGNSAIVRSECLRVRANREASR